jgi:membrane associated rhomboid family serine protease
VAAPPGPDTSPSTSVPTCFRHPGRETYVSCVRCGRPACPDCLRSAAVGQQCVDCVREGNRGVRRPGTVFGGRPSTGAVVTWTLVGINVLLYLVELVHPSLGDDVAMLGKASINGGPLQGVAQGQYYRLITSAFFAPPGLNGYGPLDILFNMWALILVGPALEKLLGRVRYLAVYLVSALGGSVMFYLIAPSNVEALGASGAIFGLFGAWFVVARRLRLDSRWIVTIIVLNLVLGFLGHSIIAWQAHVGGLLAGGLLAAAYVYAPKASRAVTQAGATVVLVAVLALAIVLRDHQLAAAALG